MSKGKEAGRALRNFEETIEEVKTDIAEINNSIDDIETAVTGLFAGMEFISESMKIILFNTDYRFIPEFVYIPNYDYFRGQAVRVGWNKYRTDGGRLDPGQTPANSPRFELFRDNASYDPDGANRHVVREEFLLQGVWRWDETSGQTSQHGWYKTIRPVVQSATPPYNDTTNWEFMGNEEPPDS